MAEDRAEAMLVVGALEAAEVSRPTGHDADQGGGETDDSISGGVRTDKAGVVTAAGATTETPLRGCRTGGARGALTAAPNVERGLHRWIGQRTSRSPRNQGSRPSQKGSQTRHSGPMRGRSRRHRMRWRRLGNRPDTGRRQAVGKNYQAFLGNSRARQSSRHNRHCWNSGTCRLRPGRRRRRRRTWH